MGDVASGTFGVRLSLPNADYAIPAGVKCRLQFALEDEPEEQDGGPERLADTPVPEPQSAIESRQSNWALVQPAAESRNSNPTPSAAFIAQ